MLWIWLKREEKYSFAEFKATFTAGTGRVELKISADFRYAVYINGTFAANGQYADYPDQKVVDTVDVSAYVKKGENELFIVAYHMGVDHFVCSRQPACVAFEVLENGKILLASSKDTLCRRSTAYSAGDTITPQQGKGMHYSFTAKETAWETAKEIETGFQTVDRPIKKTVIEDKTLGKVIAQGCFQWNGGETAGDKMQRAWLSSRLFKQMTGADEKTESSFEKSLTFKGEQGDGVYVFVDLGAERAGYPCFSVETDKPCSLYFGWGEHFADLRLETERFGRNFAFKVDLKAGKNEFSEYWIRLGCRYVCLFAETDTLKVNEVSFREEIYPFSMPKKDFGDRLLNKIYDVGRRTLQLCAHEHYEDCPWREQALYGMDSRNQMLFGYGAFGEYEFPRASIRLLAKSMSEDGLLELCPPSKADITIPSFSAYMVLAFCENAERDFNAKFVDDVLPVAEKIIQTFQKRTKDGTVHTFSEIRYWNFHEWSDGLDAVEPFREESLTPEPDAILTALVYRAATALAALENKLGRTEQVAKLQEYADMLALHFEIFYDKEKGLYASYIGADGFKGYHEYTQAVFLTTGKVDETRAKALREVLKNPKGKVVPITLGAMEVKYDALLQDRANLPFVIEEICETYGGLLFKGATSYWETIEGSVDFDNAGSLCHGWAAIACYVFDNYLKNLA
ncbi:MAG: hypothetical protein IJ317_04205 [Clostridia bacterium]|nr:hypothetical protein [Clostridia bacterium]